MEMEEKKNELTEAALPVQELPADIPDEVRQTLVRDLKYFKKKGYRVAKGVGVDMFPFTEHVESVVLMQYCGK